MQLGIEVQVWRGQVLESRHRVQCAACDRDGRLQAGTDEPGLVTSFRSAAKPFQLLRLVERGHAHRLGFRDEELAVMAASHTGSAYHRGLVTGILERIGLSTEQLACGFHPPLDPVALAEVRADPKSASALHNNCSGKHAGMLALAVAEGWPVEGYERPQHPVQQLARRAVAECCGLRSEEIATGTDDCGVVVFGLPLSAMARGYARLATASPQGDAREKALARIRQAMTSFPNAVGGGGRFSTLLIESTSGSILSKGGAEGLECLGIPARSLGLAFKCVDGSTRAVGPAVIAMLDQLGVLSAEQRDSLADASRPTLRNLTGRTVGHLEAVVEVASRAS